jgi:type II secretory pathway pseudopilin PulG
MTVVAIVGLLVAVAVPSFLRARGRSVASMVLSDARMLDGALDQYALENSKAQTSNVGFGDLTPYLKAGNKLALSGGKDSLGNTFGIGPQILNGISVNPTTKSDLSSSVGGDTFWGPYS